MKLVIVESPSKAKIISGFLGSEFIVLASKGHVKQIPSKPGMIMFSEGRIDIEWEEMASMKNLKNEIASQSKEKISEVFLATDMDREGERIACDIQEALAFLEVPVRRTIFSAITKNQVLFSIKKSRKIDICLADAAKGRSALDYYIGFNISPLLWKNVPAAKSMGRLQGPALNLIAQNEIDNLMKESYQEVQLELTLGETIFYAKAIGGWKEGLILLKSIDFKTLKQRENKHTSTSSIPFSSMSIQKHFNTLTGISAENLMKVLQELYSGKISEKEKQGLITYMRTDSTRLDPSFIQKAVVYLVKKGWPINWTAVNKMSVPQRKEGVQDAHEAIRPTRFQPLQGESVQAKIFKRIVLYTLSCFIKPAVFIKKWWELNKGKFKSAPLFKLKERGNYQMYPWPRVREGEREQPDITVRHVKIRLRKRLCWSHMKEGDLLSKLESLGVGRPSTWSKILPTLINRGYVSKDCHLSHTGFLLSQFMKDNFIDFTNGTITSWMEKRLNLVASGESNLKSELRKMLLFVQEKIKKIKGLEISNTSLIRFCCKDKMDIYFSRGAKRKPFAFFKCQKCSKLFPFNFRPEENTFISRGKPADWLINQDRVPQD